MVTVKSVGSTANKAALPGLQDWKFFEARTVSYKKGDRYSLSFSRILECSAQKAPLASWGPKLFAPHSLPLFHPVDRKAAASNRAPLVTKVSRVEVMPRRLTAF